MPEYTPTWILDRVAVAAYARFLAEHGTRMHRHDTVRLAAALSWPRTVAAFTEGRPRPSTLAAAYASAILRFRPFQQGNEAMACLLSMLFLRLNGVDLPAPLAEKFLVFDALADGRLDATGLAQWIRMRYIANQQGVKWVVHLQLRGGKVFRVATVRTDADSQAALPHSTRGRRRLPASK